MRSNFLLFHPFIGSDDGSFIDSYQGDDEEGSRDEEQEFLDMKSAAGLEDTAINVKADEGIITCEDEPLMDEGSSMFSSSASENSQQQSPTSDMDDENEDAENDDEDGENGGSVLDNSIENVIL